MRSNLDSLKPHAIWVPVIIRPKPGRPGKTDKVPTNLDGYQIDAQNPANCMDFWTADTYRHFLHLAPSESTGVGLVIRPEHGLFCVDLDDCITPSGGLSELALGMIEALPGALMERSYSGRGLHLWGYAPTIDPEHRTRSVSCPALEVYTRGRFILVTEDFCGGWLADHSAALGTMTEALLGAPARLEQFEWTDTGFNDDLSDQQIIDRIRAHRIRTPTGGIRTAAALWDGDALELADRYPSSTGAAYDGSGADLALATLLMQHTGNNAERSWRLLTESGLARGKHYRDDYRQWTVQRAYRPDLRAPVRPERLDWAETAPDTGGSVGGGEPPRPAVPDSQVSTATPPAAWSIPRWSAGAILGGAELAQHFAGCAYVRDLDQIYIPDGSTLSERQFNATFGGNGLLFQMTPDFKVSKKPWEAFLQSEVFVAPKVRGTRFDPSDAPGAIVDDTVNTWLPVHVPALEGDPAPYLDLLCRQLPDERDRRILLSWMAACVQHRDVKFRWSPYIQGVKGNGKTTHLKVLEYCIGERYTARPAAGRMDKQFNSIFDRKLLISVDDVNMGGRNALWDVLKPMITEDQMEIERKGIDSTTVRGMVAKYAFTSNFKQGLPMTADERRLAPFFCAQQTRADLQRDGLTTQYFDEFFRWLGLDKTRRGGAHGRGAAIIAHYLMHYPIDPEFDPSEACQRAPETTSSREAIAKSRTGIERHLQDAIEVTREFGADGIVRYVAVEMLYRKHNIRMPDIAELSALLAEFGFEQFENDATGPHWRRPVPSVPVS